MKTLLKLFGVLLLLLLLGLGATVYYADSLLERGVEQGASYALGVDTEVDSVSVGLLSGRLAVDGLSIHNPPGFDSPYFFSLGSVRLLLPPKTLLEDTITVPLLALDGIDVNLEKSAAGSNYQVILDSLKRFESSEAGGRSEAVDEDGGKSFVIKELSITNVNATVTLALLGDQKSSLSASIPEIKLHDIGQDSGGVDFSELAAIVTKAVLQAVSRAGIAPGDILKELSGGLGALGSVKLELPKGIEGVAGKLLSGDNKALDKALEDVGGQLGGKLGGLGEAGKALGGLGSLLGGSKDE